MEHAADRDMETSAPAGKSQLEGALVGKGSAGEGSHRHRELLGGELAFGADG